MGTATNQLMTRNDVNNKRKCVFSDDLKKCVTKGELSNIELVNVTSSISTNRCVTNADFSTNSTTFKIYYGIHNYQIAVRANLDYIKVDLSTSSSSSSGSWTEIGSSSLNSIPTVTTVEGYVTCDLAKYSNFNPATQYYIRVRCGNTNFNKTWKWSIGPSYGTSAALLNVSGTSTDRVTTSAYPLQGFSNGVLNSFDYINGVIGRNIDQAFLFGIEG